MAYREADEYREDEAADHVGSPLERRALLRQAVTLLGRRERHPAKLRRAARLVVAEFLAEQDRQARAASSEEFRRWLERRCRVSACDQRIGGPNWRLSS